MLTLKYSMARNRNLCFVDSIFPIEKYSVEGEISAKGYLLRVQAENATYYASSYFYLSLDQYNKLKERLGERMIAHGDWLYAQKKFRGKDYRYQAEIGCVAYPYTWEDVIPAPEVKDLKDDEIRKHEEEFPNIKTLHVKCPFPLDGQTELAISVLKVGQGDLILVKFPSKRKLIIDAHYARPLREKIHSHITEYFNGQPVDAMLITHKHLDHIRYADEIVARHKVREYWVGVCSDHPHSSPTVKRIYRELVSRNIKMLAITESVEYIDHDFKMCILYPAGPQCRYDCDQNKHSIILDMTWRGHRVVLGGDLHAEGWFDLYGSPDSFPKCIDFLKTPHHCSMTGLDASVIRTIKIKHAVTSCGTNDKYKHPHCEPLKSYALACQHHVTRIVGVPSINFTIGRRGNTSVSPNRAIVIPWDCTKFECYRNCCALCFRQRNKKKHEAFQI